MCETAAGVITAEEWVHAAVVSDGQNFRVYVNGELSKESPFQETRGNNQEFMIGGYAGEESYTGIVDDLALGEDDINAVMQKGVSAAAAVDSKGKMITTWAALKSAF